MAPGKFQKCKRGVFGLDSWDTPVKPKHLQEGADTAISAKETRKKMLVKYNYTPNQNSPLGREMAVTQGEYVYLLEEVECNPHWLNAERADASDHGFIPATYVQAVDTTGLPWLQGKQTEVKDKNEAPLGTGYKPYVSAYSKTATKDNDASTTTGNKEYYCEVCDKQLNGPQPYSSHMKSKAHKEELELAEWRDNN